MSEVRLRLTEEEAAEAERGRTAPHRVSASVFVRMGLELEDQQYVFYLFIMFVVLINKQVHATDRGRRKDTLRRPESNTP